MGSNADFVYVHFVCRTSEEGTEDRNAFTVGRIYSEAYYQRASELEQMKLWRNHVIEYAILSNFVARTHNVSKAIHYQVTTKLGRSSEGFGASWRSESHIQRLPSLLEVYFLALPIVTQSRRLQTARMQ